MNGVANSLSGSSLGAFAVASVILWRDAHVELEIAVEAAEGGVAAIVGALQNGFVRVAEQIAGLADLIFVDESDEGGAGCLAEIA